MAKCKYNDTVFNQDNVSEEKNKELELGKVLFVLGANL